MTPAPDPVTTKWVPLGGGVMGVPTPPVNGQFVKGSGGAVVWSAIAKADLPLPLAATDVTGLIVADTAWHYIGAAGEPAFQNGWVNFAATGQPVARFRKLASGLVCLSGLITGGTLASIAFALPVGYRPKYDVAGGSPAGSQAWFAIPSNSAFGGLTVRNDGAIVPYVGSTWWFLDNVHFYAEQ